MKLIHVSALKTSTFCMLFLLISLTSVSAIILSSSSSHAETTDTALASVTVPDVCTISTDSSSTAHEAVLGTGSYTPNIGETTLNIMCNDSNGYSLYAVGYSNNTVGNTNLVGATSNIPTGTSTATGANAVSNWAMKLAAVNGTFTPTILNSYDDYHTVPATTTKVATRTANIDLSSSSQVKTTYAVSISQSQAKGNYEGKVKYTVVHPHYTNADGTTESYPITLGFTNADSITIDGVTYTTASTAPNITYGAHSISGAIPSTGYDFGSWSVTGNVTIVDSSSLSTTINVTGAGTLTLAATEWPYMQDMTSSDCTSIARTVYDKRDNTTYVVQKLADDRCWMLDNLAIDPTTVPLSTLQGNTNASNTTLNYLKNGGGSSPNTAYAVSSSWTADSHNKPLVNTAYKNTVVNGYGSGNKKVGVYYNYCAITAGSYCYAESEATGNPSEDLCPSGWRLPTGGSSGEYRTLFIAVTGATPNQYMDENTIKIMTALSWALAGDVESATVSSQNVDSSFWTSTTTPDSVYYNYTNAIRIYYTIGRGRTSGISARCILN